MKISCILCQALVVANLVFLSLALTDEEKLSAYHRYMDPWTKGKITKDLLLSSLTAEFLTEDCWLILGAGVPKVEGGWEAQRKELEDTLSPHVSLIHKINEEFIAPDGVGHVFLDLYYVAWNADRSEMCHGIAPVHNVFTVADDGRISSFVSNLNMARHLPCLSSTAETKYEL
jgi:hypothetical protein